MNKIMCRLTGGHKFDDSKLTSEQIPDDVRRIVLHNRCVKCGKAYFAIVNIDSIIQADIKRFQVKRSDNNAE
jgi:hypothetical protein